MPAPASYALLTLEEARAALEQLHHAPVSIESVRAACIRYRQRLEGRTSDVEPVDPTAAERESPEPQDRELRCTWKPWPRRRMYLIDPADLPKLKLRWPDEAGRPAPGRKVGTGRFVARKPRPTTKDAKAKAARRSRLAS